jgi:hypothetical protein
MSEDVNVKRAAGIDIRRDGRGLALFTLGSFFTVLLALAIDTAEPLERLTGSGLLARTWGGSVGLLPGLLFCGGLAALGAWEYLTGGGKELKRHVWGLALTAAGLSVLMGAFSESAGGFLGHHSAGLLSRSVHVVPAALLGLVAFVLPVWIVWLKPALDDAPARVPIRKQDPKLPSVVWPQERASSVEVAPVAAKLQSEGLDLGVSPAEAAALIPEDLPSWRTLQRKFVSAAPPAAPHSPYPEDVRLRGEIPTGAKPLLTPHAPSPKRSEGLEEPAVPSLRERTPETEPKRSAVSAREDLALPQEKGESDPVLEMPATLDWGSRQDELEELRIALAELTFEEPAPALPAEDVPQAPEVEERAVESELDESNIPPPPSWEQPVLFEAEEEEPVDAYGTPLSVSEAAHVEAEAEELVEESEADLEPIEADVGAAADSESEEREVTLKPIAAPVASSGKKKKRASKPSPDDRTELLTEIGCHLLERGRVAVSMLQKQYGMDFEEATSVLDELQRMGLIGPYLGGQRRDILLTREEWLEKVSSL